MMFVSYCVSNIIGPMFFKSGQAPLYPLGIAAILVSYGLAIITIGTYMFVCHKENMRRDALDSAAGEQVHLDTDFKDKTDKENLVRLTVYLLCKRTFLLTQRPYAALPVCLVSFSGRLAMVGRSASMVALATLRLLTKRALRGAASAIAITSAESSCNEIIFRAFEPTSPSVSLRSQGYGNLFQPELPVSFPPHARYSILSPNSETRLPRTCSVT